MNITEEDLKNAEKELEEFIKEEDEKKEKAEKTGLDENKTEADVTIESVTDEDKKTN